MTLTAADRLNEVLGRIADAAERAGRSAAGIALVAVTKTVPFEKVLPFLEAGVKHVGENRVQEATAKFARGTGPVLHLIGPLQSNKAKKAVEFFDMIQSLDRLDLAQDLERHARDAGKIQDCLVQIKISEEATKSGLDPGALSDFLQKLQTLTHLKIRGLMGIPPLRAQGPESRPYFARLRRLFESTPYVGHPDFTVLSMGMSADYEIAVEEGATMVRIGSALFGPRSTTP